MHQGPATYLNALVRPVTVVDLLASPILALGFGIVLALAETVRRWGHWPFLPFLLDDWIAGLFLVYGAVRSRRDWDTGRPVQAAAWAFTSGMLYMSFFGHLEHWSKPLETGWVPHDALVAIIGLLFALALAGLVGTLLRGSRAQPTQEGGS
jgi:hypothetical protein